MDQSNPNEINLKSLLLEKNISSVIQRWARVDLTIFETDYGFYKSSAHYKVIVCFAEKANMVLRNRYITFGCICQSNKNNLNC